jgi:hypothetical protein
MAIFGKILYLPYASGTIVFISVLVVFTLFEGCKDLSPTHVLRKRNYMWMCSSSTVLHVIEVECRKRGLKVGFYSSPILSRN